jgi:hypothetical protein
MRSLAFVVLSGLALTATPALAQSQDNNVQGIIRNLNNALSGQSGADGNGPGAGNNDYRDNRQGSDNYNRPGYANSNPDRYSGSSTPNSGNGRMTFRSDSDVRNEQQHLDQMQSDLNRAQQQLDREYNDFNQARRAYESGR